MKERNTYFDVLRAVAIILVIANHTSSVAPDNMVVTALNRIVKIAVPLFIAISGFFLSKKVVDNWNGYSKFLRKQIPRVYIPLLLFSLPFIFGNGLALRSVVGRAAMSLLGAGLYPFYFVFLIAQYYVLLPAFQRLSRRGGGNSMSAIVSLMAIGIVTFFNGVKSADLPIFIYAGLFPVFAMFFTLGCYLGTDEKKRQYKLKPILIALPFALILACAEDWYLRENFTACGLTVTTFIFVYLVVWLLMSRQVENAFNKVRTRMLVKALAKVGQWSYVIFLMHAYIIELAEHYGLLTGIWTLNIVIVLCTTTLVTYIIYKITPQQLRKYWGF